MISFSLGLTLGLVLGAMFASATIVAGMGLYRTGLDEIKAHNEGLADQLGEPTLAKSRKRTLT